MNRKDRAERDRDVIKEYLAGATPRALGAKYGINAATVFIILNRNHVVTRTGRGPNKQPGATRRIDADAHLLVVSKFCRDGETATRYLRQADFYQQNPHMLNLADMGVNRAKLSRANDALAQVKSYITFDSPFTIFMPTRNAFLSLTFRQLLLFLAAPYPYLLRHKSEIRDFTGALQAEAPLTVAPSTE